MPYDPTVVGAVKCSYECTDVEPELSKGGFRFMKLDAAWQIMEHIRDWGSAVSGMEVWSDFRPFFEAHPGGVYKGPGALQAGRGRSGCEARGAARAHGGMGML